MKTKSSEFTHGARVDAMSGAEVEEFKASHGLTVAEACSILGISTPQKYAVTVRKPAEDMNFALALLMRFYSLKPDMVPKAHPMELADAYEMFKKVIGPKFDESIFGQLFGRTPGSGYRWLRSKNSRATPQVTRLLDRLSALRQMGMSDEEVVSFWLSFVRLEYQAKGKVFLLDKEKKVKVAKEPVKINRTKVISTLKTKEGKND
jgi:hypothetical protein